MDAVACLAFPERGEQLESRIGADPPPDAAQDGRPSAVAAGLGGLLSEWPRVCGSSDLDSTSGSWFGPPGVPGKSFGLRLLCRVEIKTQEIPHSQPLTMRCPECSVTETAFGIFSEMGSYLGTENQSEARGSRRMAAQGPHSAS